MNKSLTQRTFGGLRRFRDEIDDLFERFFPEEGFIPTIDGGFAPPMDVVEKNDTIVVKAELPGIDPEDIDISITGDILTVRGEKKHESKEEGEGYLRRERIFGSFSRTITLPAHVKPDECEASYDSGVLAIRLQKAESSKSQKIKVRAR